MIRILDPRVAGSGRRLLERPSLVTFVSGLATMAALFVFVSSPASAQLLGAEVDGESAEGAGESVVGAELEIDAAAPASAIVTGSFLDRQLSFSRVAKARAVNKPGLEALFREKEIPFPPADLYLRVFKAEQTVEVWVRPTGGAGFSLLTEYPICAVSGWLGPKRNQGDHQIPEGFYEVEAFNPASEYHLSLRVNYPNAADRLLAGGRPLGGDIYVHGGCSTIGCVPITDEHIAELYWLAVETRNNPAAGPIPVHIFPTRLDAEGMGWLADSFGEDSELMDFWEELREGYAYFEEQRRVPTVLIDGNGRYLVGEDALSAQDRNPDLLGAPVNAVPPGQ